MLKTGLTHRRQLTVSSRETAKTIGSGALDVLATPSLIALMEQTAWQSVQKHLDKGKETVGTFLEIKHLAPTPVGMVVECVSELTAINNRELTFHIEVRDKHDKIAEATHKRFVIEAEPFQKKANGKLLK